MRRRRPPVGDSGRHASRRRRPAPVRPSGRPSNSAGRGLASRAPPARLARHEEAAEPGRAPHHDRRCRPADVDRLLGGRARHALRLRAAQPRPRSREPPLLRSRRRAPDHDLHQRGAHARPGADADRSRLRPPRRVRHLAGDVRAGRRAARRTRHRAQRRQGSRLHGLDLLQGPARAADRARLLPLRAAVGLHAQRRAARGAQAPRGARRPPHRPRPRRRRDRGARAQDAPDAQRRPRAEAGVPGDPRRRTAWPTSRSTS